MPEKTHPAYELLAPAKDADIAIAAIRCGADAVYMGAARFSARQAAGNSLDDIRRVVEFAHQYYAKVYIALNTLLYDDELPAAEKLIHELDAIGIDALIIQDPGLLELDLPPLPLIASTQMDNASPAKIKLLEAVGFSRAILARELSLEQIRRIREQTSIELEAFVHGALCVSASGRCWMSWALGRRSGNRGRCAQPCRRPYTLKDPSGKIPAHNRCLLSLKDLNLSARLGDLIDAGVTSFKIEGRLKDLPYVVNTVAFYRRQLDAVLQTRGLQKSSSGSVRFDFVPDPNKTFTRGFTEFNIDGRCEQAGSIDTPKSRGEYIGTVRACGRSSFTLDTAVELHNGDGLCFFDPQGDLTGTVVNRIEGPNIIPQKMDRIRPGMTIYRNYDHEFIRRRLRCPAQRRIQIALTLRDTPGGVSLHAKDEDGVEAAFELTVEKQPAEKPDMARQTIRTQLSKLGDTGFECTDIRIETNELCFFPHAVLNQLKRGLIEALIRQRERHRPRPIGGVRKNSFPYPEKHLTWRENVLNEKARSFYRRHGVETIEPAAEAGLEMQGKQVMTTKYCLREELGLCTRKSDNRPAGPLLLIDEEGREFLIHFQCGPCGMQITFHR